MTTRVSLSLLSLTALLLVFPACKGDDPCADGGCPDNEQEVITTIRLTFSTPDTALTFTWKDTDGMGGNAPVIDTITLDAARTYLASVEVLDESKTPTANITTEILAEKEAHQFFFHSPQDSINDAVILFAYNDFDADGKPVGLVNFAETTLGGGKLRVTLLHGLDKTAPGAATGNPAAAGGEADVDVYFPVRVK